MTRISVAVLALPIAAACLGLWLRRAERRAAEWVEETHDGLEGE